jgi:hypothetical protein
MAATQASEMLERFAAGSAPANVCTPEGRALLRGAVRAYGAEMARAGVAWPAVPARGEGEIVKGVDATVLAAFAAGFVEASDFRGRARALIGEFSLAQWPHLGGVRQAARVACEEVVELQQAMARLVLEAERYQDLALFAAREGGPRAQQRVERQEQRLQRAQTQMQLSAAQVEVAVRAARQS